MIIIKRCAVIAALGAALTGCTSGQSAVEPSFTPVNIAQTTTLKFAVGTANLNGGALTGLNTVVTFRQNANGLDGTLLNSPTIVGPAGFVNTGTPAQVGVDSGTNQISASPFVVLGTTALVTTFNNTGGAFSYGFAPENATNTAATQFGQYNEPFFTGTNPPTLGPPLTGFFRDGSFPSTFRGYPSGFTAFEGFTLPPAGGLFTLNVNIPSANVAATNLSTTANLTSLAFLPAMPAPVFARNGVADLNGQHGATVTVTIPAGLTEAIVYVQDRTLGSFYSIKTTTPGLQTLVIPDSIGPHGFGLVPAPQTIVVAPQPATIGASFNVGDAVRLYVVGFDYPAFEAAPPLNTSAAPTIVGANGQADITMSTTVNATY